MIRTILVAIACLLGAALCQGQTKEESAPRTFEFGFEQRVRNENWNNITDFSDRTDDEREQIRYRTRVWFKAPVTSWLDVSVGLNQETNQKMAKVNHFDEVVLDTAYLNFKKLFVKGLSLQVGRQNLGKGEGFIIFEGTPGDGSRTLYSNSFDLAYSWKKSKIDVIGIMNPRQDRFLPRIHSQGKYLQDWDQSALGAYYTDNNHKDVGVEAYYLYDKEVHDYLAPTNPQFQPDRHVHTAGGRVVRQLPHSWSVTGEFAGQWGAQHGGKDIRGWGGYAYTTKQIARRWKPYVQVGEWLFSGDDPSTKNTIEGWDPLFGRWPRWSELYIYSQVCEYGVSYWTNTAMTQFETGFTPLKHISGRLTYYHMNAFHPFPRSTNPFGAGTTRGDLFEARVDYTATANWKAHVLYEGLVPGSYYQTGNRGYFLRFEISYLITSKLTGHQIKNALGFRSSGRDQTLARM